MELSDQLHEVVRSSAIEVSKYLSVLFIGFIGTQIIGYYKMKRELMKLSGDVRNLGIKVSSLKDKIHDEYIQQLLEDSKIKQEIGNLKGQLHAFELFYLKDKPSGQAS